MIWLYRQLLRQNALLLAVLVAFPLLVSSGWAMQYQFAPVTGQITSGFGWRTDPFNGSGRFHSGVDIAAPYGTPIYATQNGTVVFSGYYGGYGNCVVVDHGYGLYTLYGHAAAYYVSPGQPVFKGQTLAVVGSTGRSTGPHLHFEVHQNRQYVNPMNYLAYLGYGPATAPSGASMNAVAMRHNPILMLPPKVDQTPQDSHEGDSGFYKELSAKASLSSPAAKAKAANLLGKPSASKTASASKTVLAKAPAKSQPKKTTSNQSQQQLATAESAPIGKPNKVLIRRHPKKNTVELLQGERITMVKF